MLLNSFFEILEVNKDDNDPASVKIKVRLNKKHPIYEGHFPGNPVVPGVCLIQMIKELIESSLNKNLKMIKADTVKFMNMVSPEENDTLTFELNVKTIESIQVKANIVSGEKIFLKFSGAFK